MGLTIRDIEYYLPEQTLDNAKLQKENPAWDMALLEKRIGVQNRHIAADHETALDLAVKACGKLLAKHPDLKASIDGLIFCTQSEDYVMPPNSCILHKALDLPERVFSYDFNLACSGFVYGLFMARAFINSNSARNILLINADTYSKYIHKQDRSARILFGDGAAATWLTESPKGLIDIVCATSGNNNDAFIIPAGGCRTPRSKDTGIANTDKSGNVRTLENIHMDGTKIISFVNSKVPAQIKELLSKNNMTIDDVDLFVLHQASQLVLDYLKSALKIPEEKFFRNLLKIGNTVSSSIPIALKDAMTQGKIKAGDKVLVSGFGVGLSWGTALMEIV